MSSSFPSSIKPLTSVLTYVFKKGSPKIQVLLNYIKNKNDGTLVKQFTDKNGYTTVTSTSSNLNASAACTTPSGSKHGVRTPLFNSCV
jgi:hypothetical protein